MSDITPTFCGLTAEEIMQIKQRNAELAAQVDALQGKVKSTNLEWYRRGFESCIDQIIDFGILSENGSIITKLRQQAKAGEL